MQQPEHVQPKRCRHNGARAPAHLLAEVRHAARMVAAGAAGHSFRKHRLATRRGNGHHLLPIRISHRRRYRHCAQCTAHTRSEYSTYLRSTCTDATNSSAMSGACILLIYCTPAVAKCPSHPNHIKLARVTLSPLVAPVHRTPSSPPRCQLVCDCVTLAAARWVSVGAVRACGRGGVQAGQGVVLGVVINRVARVRVCACHVTHTHR